MARSLRQRPWFFEVRQLQIFVIRDGVEIEAFTGRKMGPVKDITVGKQITKGRSSDQAILILFGHDKGLVSRENFVSNKNDFCLSFQWTKNAEEFVQQFHELTTFDRVNHTSILSPVSDELSPSDSHLTDCGEKRASEEYEQVPLPKKKNKVDRLDFCEAVTAKKIGLFDLPVKSCVQPPSCRLLRKVDTVFVQALKKRLQNDASGIGIPPLAVICKDVNEIQLFEERLKNVYTYEVHGGVHSIKAHQELNAETGSYQSVLCVVYAGLTDEEALWLASRHNDNGHFQHDMTHRNYLEACRSRLYAMTGKDPSVDEVPSPTVEWKRTCTKCILPQVFSRTQRENIFAQSVFSKSSWDTMQSVMNMYEKGELKDQKLNKKQMITVPEIKQHHFQPLHNLPSCFQQAALQKMIEKTLSLKELKAEATRFRSLQTIQRAFVRCTSSQSWEEAKEKYPSFVVDERLLQFAQMDFLHTTPDMFKSYCQSAINSQTPMQGSLKKVEGVRVGFVIGELASVSAQDVKAVDPAYTGAQLILFSVPKSCSPDLVEKVAYTSRQLNSMTTAIQFFNLVILCTLDEIDAVKLSLLKCFDCTETAYAYNKTAKQQGSDRLVPALKGIVIGYWSQNGTFDKHQRNGSHLNVFEYTSSSETDENVMSYDLKKEIIQTFSYDGQTVIDGSASFSLAAQELKRNLIVVCDDQPTIQILLNTISEIEEKSDSQ